MISIGICTDLDHLEAAKAMGYAYAELALARLAAMPAPEFQAARERIAAAGLCVPACNVLLPSTLAVTGPQADPDALCAYLEGALGRAAAIGAETVVFGSGAARRIPDGFDRSQAREQLIRFLRDCGRIAAGLGIRIAIEPLCQAETNVIHTVPEAVTLAEQAAMPSVRALGDTYHMAKENDPLDSLVKAGPMLLHVHVANPEGRLYPRPGDGQSYAALFEALRRAGYAGRVSVEVGQDSFEEGAPLALQTLLAAQGEA